MVLIFAEQQTDAGFNTHAKQQPTYAATQQPQQMTNAPTMYGYGYNNSNTNMMMPQQHQHQHLQQHDKARYLLAERYKTKMCRNYMTTGACPYTHRCMFAHGQQELRTTDMNVRDGLMTEEAIKSFQRAMTAYNRGELSSEVSYATTEAPQQHETHYTEQCPCDDCVAAAAKAATQHNPYYSAMPQAFTTYATQQQAQE